MQNVAVAYGGRVQVSDVGDHVIPNATTAQLEVPQHTVNDTLNNSDIAVLRIVGGAVLKQMPGDDEVGVLLQVHRQESQKLFFEMTHHTHLSNVLMGIGHTYPPCTIGSDEVSFSYLFHGTVFAQDAVQSR